MALTFEYEKNLDTGTTPFISHEPDSTIYNYFMEGEAALDKSATAPFGVYGSLTFGDADKNLTTRAVSRIGIKNFPGVGAIGFYTDAYSDDSYIVAPVHHKQTYHSAPVLTTVEIKNSMLRIVVTPPDSIDYTCYRVVVRQGTFAFEYIIYKTEYYVDIPPVKGNYTVTCIGYDEDNASISETSNVLSLTVPTGEDSFAPPDIGGGGSIDAYTKAEIDAMLGDLNAVKALIDAMT